MTLGEASRPLHELAFESPIRNLSAAVKTGA